MTTKIFDPFHRPFNDRVPPSHDNPLGLAQQAASDEVGLRMAKLYAEAAKVKPTPGERLVLAPLPPEFAGPTDKPSNPKDIVGIRKAPMSTVSAAVLAEVGVAMLEGALKYGRHNYRAVGVRSSVYYDGTMRHLMDWWEGVDIDPDSDMHHITKAITSLIVLRDAMIQGKCTDDRPPRSKAFYAELNARASALMDKHADKSPHHYTINDKELTNA